MLNLRPALWRTCRVIACETRLQLLWHILDEGESSVTDAMLCVGVSQPNASNQLRALCDRGLIIPRRESMEVIYRAEANGSASFAPEILDALRICYERSVAFATIIRQATAFTHERRIEIVRALRGRSLSTPALRDATGMSPSALLRHLDKLEKRGFVKEASGSYRMGAPGNALGRTLLKLAVR